MEQKLRESVCGQVQNKSLSMTMENTIDFFYFVIGEENDDKTKYAFYLIFFFLSNRKHF